MTERMGRGTMRNVERMDMTGKAMSPIHTMPCCLQHSTSGSPRLASPCCSFSLLPLKSGQPSLSAILTTRTQGRDEQSVRAQPRPLDGYALHQASAWPGAVRSVSDQAAHCSARRSRPWRDQFSNT